MWLAKMTPDHCKLMCPKIIAEHMAEQELDRAEPNFPRSVNRFGVTCSTHAEAVKFHSDEEPALQVPVGGERRGHHR